jgi:hypothetical protein
VAKTAAWTSNSDRESAGTTRPSYASDLPLLRLGPNATASQLAAAFCARVDLGGIPIAFETYTLASTYYDWNFPMSIVYAAAFENVLLGAIGVRQVSNESENRTVIEPSTQMPCRAPFDDHSMRITPRPLRVPGGASAPATGSGR